MNHKGEESAWSKENNNRCPFNKGSKVEEIPTSLPTDNRSQTFLLRLCGSSLSKEVNEIKLFFLFTS
jgi:hypothetical protein